MDMPENIYVTTMPENIYITTMLENVYEDMVEEFNQNESIYEDLDNQESSSSVKSSDIAQNDKTSSQKRARVVKTMACVLSLLLLACAGLGVYFCSTSHTKYLNQNSTLGNDQSQSLLKNVTIRLNDIATSAKPTDNLQSFLKKITLRYSEKVNSDQEGNTVSYDVIANNYPKDPDHHTAQGASLTACSDDKAFTYIGSAIHNNNMQLVKSLLQRGCSANARNLNHGPLLFYALALNRHMAFNLLLEHGANVNAKSSGGKTVLCVTAEKGQRSTVETLLLKYGAFVNGKNRNNGNTPLLCARSVSDLNIIESLLAFGADTEATTLKVEDQTLLIWASAENNTDLVRILLKYKAEVDAKDISGQTALIFSSYKGNLEVVDLLLRAGANVNDTDNKRRNALFFSTRKKHLNISQLLIRAFSDVNMPDHKLYTPIYNAARKNDIPMAKLLLENNADINGFSKNDGQSDIFVTCKSVYLPLQIAVYRGYNKFLEYLIQNGATVNKPGCLNKTALHYAAHKRNLEGVRMLIKAGSNINAVDQNGETPLHKAVKISKNIEIIKFLLNNNAQLRRNVLGSTPLVLAQNYKRSKHVIELLKDSQ